MFAVDETVPAEQGTQTVSLLGKHASVTYPRSQTEHAVQLDPSPGFCQLTPSIHGFGFFFSEGSNVLQSICLLSTV